MNEALILYTRDQCELCEQAAAISREAGVSVRPVNISGDIELLMRYRHTIPVLRDPVSGAEISWPFDAAAVIRFGARQRSLPGLPTAT